MPDRKRILLFGTSNMNLSLNIARLPDKGEVISDEGGVSYSPGGAGGNSAVAFARLGADAELVTRLGQDLYGQKLYTYYKDAGVNTSFIKVDRDLPTGLTVTVSEADGSSRAINFHGANEGLTLEDAAEALKRRPDGVFISFDSSFQNAQKLARLSAARGIPAFVHAHPADANHPLDTLGELELFILSEKDAKRYTGISPASSQDQLRVAFSLWRKVRAKYIVINYESRGAMIYDGKRCELVSPVTYEKPVDRSGTRDAFSAALVAEYLRTSDVKAAAKYALAASAVCAARFGTSSSIPTDGELREIIATL